MVTNKLFRKGVLITIPMITLAVSVYFKTALGSDNEYKNAKMEERFKKSALHQYKASVAQTINTFQEKTDNLESLNQNLEGRVNVLSTEKEKLNKSLAQMKVKQSTMENEQIKLKKRASSLEVAYKKMSGKNKVATSSKKPKSVAKKTSATKVTQKKTGAKPQNVVKKTTVTSARKTEGPKVSTRETEKTEDTNASQVSSPVQPPEKPTAVEKPSEEQKTASAHESDVKRINEKGIEYGRQGKYDEAIREFQKVAAIEPNMANIHYNLGLAFKKKGMSVEAEKEFAEYERLKGQEGQNN